MANSYLDRQIDNDHTCENRCIDTAVSCLCVNLCSLTKKDKLTYVYRLYNECHIYYSKDNTTMTGILMTTIIMTCYRFSLARSKK